MLSRGSIPSAPIITGLQFTRAGRKFYRSTKAFSDAGLLSHRVGTLRRDPSVDHRLPKIRGHVGRIAEHVYRGAQGRRGDVRVTHCRGDARMAKERLHGRQRHTAHGEVRRERVPQHMPCDLAHSCHSADERKLVIEPLAAVRGTSGVGEHGPGRAPAARQDVMQLGIERNVPGTVALRRDQGFLILAKRVSYGEASGLPVDGRPLQAAQFALPHAGAQGGQDHGVHGAVGILDQTLALLRRQVVGAAGRTLRPLDARWGAVETQPVVGGHEAFVQDGQMVSDRLVGKAALNLLRLVALDVVRRDACDRAAAEAWNEGGLEDVAFGHLLGDLVVGSDVLDEPLSREFGEGRLRVPLHCGLADRCAARQLLAQMRLIGEGAGS